MAQFIKLKSMQRLKDVKRVMILRILLRSFSFDQFLLMLWVLFFLGTKMIYIIFHFFVCHILDTRMWWNVILVILIYFF